MKNVKREVLKSVSALAVFFAVFRSAVFAAGLDAGDTLRVMTFNVRYCYDENGRTDLERTAERIAAEDPDVCCLQECGPMQGVDTPLRLASATGMHVYFYHDEAINGRQRFYGAATLE